MNNVAATIIICTANRAETLRQTLSSMAEVCVPEGSGCELLVVDNASTDHTKQVVQEAHLPQMTVRYLHEPRRGKGYAYNQALAAAQGDVLISTDDDVRPAADWLLKMYACLAAGTAAGGVGAVQGQTIIPPFLLRPWMETQHKNLLASTEGYGEVPLALQGANMAFLRDVLAKVPQFNTDLGPGALGFAEDTLFSLQLKEAGFRLATAFDARIEHHFDPSRLQRVHWRTRGINEGRSHGYLAHHWHHREIPRAPLYLIHRTLRLRYRRLQQREQRQSSEGIPLWELNGLLDIAFYSYFLKERRRPRKYEKHGLIKLTEPARRGK